MTEGVDLGPNLGFRLDELGDGVPLPPYQIKGCTMIAVGVEYDAASLAHVVPAELRPTSDASGGMFCYSAERGGGIAPFSAMAFWVDVEGYDSPIGSQARYLPRSFFSGRASIAIGRWGPACRQGETAISISGDRVSGSTTTGSGMIARVSMLPEKQVRPTSAGTHYYLFSDHEGGLAMSPLAFSYEVQLADTAKIEMFRPEHPLSWLTPRRVTWAAHVREGALTLGAPQPLDGFAGIDTAESRRVLESTLSRIGTAALIVDRSGNVHFQNDAVRNLDGDGVIVDRNQLRASSPGDHKSLKLAIENAFRTRSPGLPEDPTQVRRPSGKKPFLVSVAALTATPDSLGRRAAPAANLALVLIGDTERPVAVDPKRALQVMGLTRAEAEVAAVVGGGASPRDAARSLGKTEGTVRTTLKHAFSKLELSRQSELALLVSKLGSLGF